MEPLLYFVVYLCSRIAIREACKVVTCCKCCICCFPLFSRICPREGSIHGTLVVFCCLPLQQDCNTRSVRKVVTCCKCCICCFPLLSRNFCLKSVVFNDFYITQLRASLQISDNQRKRKASAPGRELSRADAIEKCGKRGPTYFLTSSSTLSTAAARPSRSLPPAWA